MIDLFFMPLGPAGVVFITTKALRAYTKQLRALRCR